MNDKKEKDYITKSIRFDNNSEFDGKLLEFINSSGKSFSQQVKDALYQMISSSSSTTTTSSSSENLLTVIALLERICKATEENNILLENLMNSGLVIASTDNITENVTNSEQNSNNYDKDTSNDSGIDMSYLYNLRS